MNRLRWALWLCVGGAALLTALAWAWSGSAIMAAAGGGIVLAGGLWAAERWPRLAGAWLAVGLGLAAGGSLAVGVWWLALPAGTLLLAGWDLLRLRQRLAAAGRVENETQLLNLHLRWLALAAALGLAAGIAAAIARLELRLEWAIVLGLIFALSLSGALRGIRRREAD
ncbi:MAG: hypothetical protein Kow0031_04970 [Anaerolineae bacterium]